MGFFDFFACTACTHSIDSEVFVEATEVPGLAAPGAGRKPTLLGQQELIKEGIEQGKPAERQAPSPTADACREHGTPSTGLDAIEATCPPISPSNVVSTDSPSKALSEENEDSGEDVTGVCGHGATAGGTASSRAPELRSRLSAKDLAAVEALELELGPSGLADAQALLVAGEPLESLLLRFLTHSNLRVKPAAKAMRAVLSWRADARPDRLAEMCPSDIAGCPQEVLDQYMPTWHQGFDKSGRPVMFSHYGKFRFGPIFEAGVTVDQILELHIRNSELLARRCGEQSARLGADISNSLIILDTEGWDNNNLKHKAAFDWARGIAKIDADYYPERMGQMFVINAPPSVNWFYKLVCWMLPEKARSQVKIFAGREQWEPALLELIDASVLPQEYGGTAPPSNAAGA